MIPAMLSRRRLLAVAGGLAAAGSQAGRTAGKKRIVFIAGRKSHPYGQHAHNAGCLLLASCLRESLPGVEAVVHRDGWPSDPSVLEGASTLVIYMDGGSRHPILPHLGEVDRLMRQGVGLTVLHYALCVPKGEAGDRFLDWIGGYYEEYWSVNPFWSPRFDALPDHPIARGVKPFAIRDEWYYHMRFRQAMAGVVPILTAAPPDATRERPDGPHSGNPVVRSRKGVPEHVAWAYRRPTGGRGFGFTGGHYHWSWEQDDVRRIVLNGIAWTAGIEVSAGIALRRPTWDELLANQEGTMPEGFGPDQARQAISPRRE
jgi:type 1 glutamine amidotransferase